MYETYLWCEKPCLCAICMKLRTSFINAYDALRLIDQRSPTFLSIRNATSTICGVAEQLHKEHRRDLYRNLQSLSIAGSNGPEHAQLAIQPPPRESIESDKVIVCDHCMAHGLVCNEAAVCEQCIVYGQPCIHRWCSHSPTSKEDCPKPRCRYLHMDAVPHVEDELKWIIFKGNLQPYLAAGKLPSLHFMLPATKLGLESLRRTLNERQSEAVKLFVNTITEQGGMRRYEQGETYAAAHITCHCAVT